MPESDSENNRGSASELLAAFPLLKAACLPPRRIAAAPLESISSFLSSRLEVNLGQVLAWQPQRLELLLAAQLGCAEERGSATKRALRVSGPCLCRKEPWGPLFPFPAGSDDNRCK